MTSGNDCNHSTKSFRRLRATIAIIFQNHCNDFFKQAKSKGFLVEILFQNAKFEEKIQIPICHFDIIKYPYI